MAKLNSIIGEIRGKLGGMVFSANRFGAFMRRKVTPVDPRTQRQGNARGRFSTATIQWSSLLTSLQRAGWTSYANATPMTDVFGNSITWPGFLWFVRVATLRNLSGLAVLEDPPSTGGLAIVQNTGIIENACALYDSNGVLYDCLDIDIATIAAEPGWDPNADEDCLLFYISSQPISDGQTGFQGPFYHIGTLIGDSVSPPTGHVQFSLDFEPINGTRWYIIFRRLAPDGKTSAKYQFELIGSTDSGP